MATARRSGLSSLTINGEVYNHSGTVSYNLGEPLRRAQLDESGATVGYFEEPQENFIETQIIDADTLDLEALVNLTDATVTIQLANGKVLTQRSAWYSGDGNAESREGKITFRSTGLSLDEI